MNLLFHQAALGDFVLTFPLLRAMGPTTVVAPWSRGRLAMRVFPRVSSVDIEMFEFTRLWSERGPSVVSPAVRELFERATLIVSFIADARSPWAANVARLAPGAKLAFVAPRPPEGWREHVTRWHDAELKRQDVTIVAEEPAPQGAADGPVVVHPGSGGREKCWPAERFETLVAELRAGGRTVVPVLGEAEGERWEPEVIARWREELGAKALTSLDELLDLVRSASLYVGNDAGPTHLAAQLGAPTVALFGPSNPRVWAPLGPRVTVLAPPDPSPMEWLDVARVVAACGAPR